MEYKNNQKYFKQNIKPIIAGIILLAVGIIVKFIFDDEYSWEIRQMYMLLIVGGALCIILYFVIRPKDSELELQINKFVEGDEELAKEKVQNADKRCKIIESMRIADYIPEHDDILLYRGTDGTVRTNWFSSSVMVLTNKRFYVYRKIFCITEENVTEEFIPFEYTDVDECTIDTVRKEYAFGKKTALREISTFNVCTKGNTVSFITHYDSFVDEFCERLNRRIRSAKDPEEQQ